MPARSRARADRQGRPHRQGQNVLFLPGPDFQTGPPARRQPGGNARQDGPPAVQPVIATIKRRDAGQTRHLGRQPVDLAGRDIGRIAQDQVKIPGAACGSAKSP